MVNRYGHRTLLLAASILLLSVSVNILFASEVEKWLLMPGDVAQAHAHIEAECSLCHAPLSDELQGELCVDCHTTVGDDLRSALGFHGRMSDTEKFECASCHTDHEGRDLDMAAFDIAAFQHSATDFLLQGAHSDLACQSCHAADTPFRDAPGTCVDCHRSDDVHNGSLGDDCASCHGNDDWQQTLFNHAATPFPLTGAHTNVTCNSCHLSPVFSDVGKTCVACHQSEDVHKGQNGDNCASCHRTDNWTGVTFDHLAVSGFALTGGHDDLTCGSCHKADDHRDLGGSTCQSCHANDDVHNGSFGSDCSSCHNPRDWASTQFDHASQTDFALPPGHNELACVSCHTSTATSPLPEDCGTCHVENDPHKGQLGSVCESCHAPTTWTGQLWFDHDITSFPLIGAHADASCNDCHATAAFRDADTQCISCHLEEDPHDGGLGNQCESCHNPAAWHAWLFDHDLTDFELTGAHIELSCATCHTAPINSGTTLPQDCNSCHKRDDRHGGRFGDNCGSCHTTESFSQIGER